MEWTVYFQNPEDYDDQGLYLKAPGEDAPWQSETDCEEFDYILYARNMDKSGYVRDLKSANRALAHLGISGEAVKTICL